MLDKDSLALCADKFIKSFNTFYRLYCEFYCSGIEYEELACKYRLFTLEEFKEKFPYEVGDKVITTSNNVFRIKEMMWNNKEIIYSLAHGEGTLCWYNTAELRPYKEEDIEKIESTNYTELEQQLDEILAKKPTESLNKCMDEENMKEDKKAKGYCTEEPEDCSKTKKLAWFTFWDNDFADEVELYLKDRELVQKDGKWFVVKKNLSRLNLKQLERQLDEALEKETPESLNKWMDEEIKKEYKIGQNVTYRDGIDCMIFHSKIVDIKDGIYYLENRDEIKYENILNEYIGVEPIGDEPKAPILSNRYDYAEGKCGYVIPNGYEFDSIKQGFQTEIIIRPIKPQYLKTYKECFNICFGNKHHIIQVVGLDGLGDNKELFESFIKLKICRDAYWKIAGEQMGLDKPWKPDWCNENKLKYCIECSFGTIDKTVSIVNGCFLAFPTAEMRDAFSENFKELIEQCKELL